MEFNRDLCSKKKEAITVQNAGSEKALLLRMVSRGRPRHHLSSNDRTGKLDRLPENQAIQLGLQSLEIDVFYPFEILVFIK